MKSIYFILGLSLIILAVVIISLADNRSDINRDGKVDMADVSILMSNMTK